MKMLKPYLASWKNKISDIAKAVCGSTATENDVEKNSEQTFVYYEKYHVGPLCDKWSIRFTFGRNEKNLLPNVISNWQGLDEELGDEKFLL